MTLTQDQMAARITTQLCTVWGWEPDEEEAVTLGKDLAALLPEAVARTRTTPDSLIEALLYNPRLAEAYRRALSDIRDELFGDTDTLPDGSRVVYAEDVNEHLRALALHNPFTTPPVVLVTETGKALEC